MKIRTLVTLWLVIGCLAPALAQKEEATGPQQQLARVYTEVVKGDPNQPGSTFDVALKIKGNSVGPIGTYAYRLLIDSDMLSVEGVSDGGDGFQQPPSVDDKHPNSLAFSGLWAASTLTDGALCIFHFKTREGELKPYSIGLAPIEPTPLVSTSGFVNVPHEIDTTATADLGVAENQQLKTTVVAHRVGAEPLVNGATVAIAVSLEGNDPQRPIGTYAFSLGYSPDALQFVGARSGLFRASPTTSVKSPLVHLSAYHGKSTFANGTMLVAEFRVTNAAAERLGVLVQDFGPTPLVSTDHKPVPHTFRQQAADLKKQ